MERLYIPGNENYEELKEYFGVETLQQVNTLVFTEELDAVRLMRDGHLGYQSMPIGGVTASRNHLAPGGAGFDLYCGNWIGKTDIHASYFDRTDLEHIGHEILQHIAVGKGVGYGTFADHPLLDNIIKELQHIGIPEGTIRNQFGSVGAGNHYIDLMRDTEGYIWIALHYGSRQVGHAIASFYLDLLDAKDGMHSPPTFLDAWSEIGNQYLHDIELAGQYAQVSRRLVGTKIATQILQDTIVDTVENHHNFINFEEHFGEELFITRKGATPVEPGVRSFIGGSMGTDSVIVTVRDDEESILQWNRNLKSAPHGAGRLIGRSQAKGSFKNGVMKRAPRVTQEMMDEWVTEFGVVRVGGDVDESPHCYRNLVEDVLPYHQELQVVELLRPVLTVMNPDKRGR